MAAQRTREWYCEGSAQGPSIMGCLQIRFVYYTSIRPCPRLSVRPSVRQSVRLSVCGVPRHNWRTERPRKPKIDRMKAHHTGNQWTYSEVKRSKVKVTRPSNVQTVKGKGKAYELQTWYTDAARRPASATSVVTFKVKGQGRKVTWCVWQVFADKSRTKRPRNTKIGRKVA